MVSVPYLRGLSRVAEGCYAWFEPPGSWGLSNSGIVVAGDEVLVIDTQNDVPRARALRAAARAVAGSAEITTVVNTHDDGDHWFGNLLFEGCRIIATEASLAGMRALRMNPLRLEELGEPGTTLHGWLRWRTEVFDYESWRPVHPTETFAGSTTVKPGGTTVELLQVGPAHTAGDAIVHVPSAGVVFAGDIVFHRSTPITWAGPVSNYIAACETILALDPAVIVPGHGPVAGPAAVRDLRDYLSMVLEYTSRQFAAGVPVERAYREIDLGAYRLWPHASRVFQTMCAIYAELGPAQPRKSWAEAMEIVLADDQS
ncbi:MBL fold metallo-hydrolase [Amycolatopsis pithecellobii]|uniref:MBL fold metallo-hydrolase n=1 Tax=Amycolatopsis pithecellobii TaxID=664692 RepID=A0A6N7Z361_9PSEU|nr:MBL fold metallo-hydrolase [Amycolatopsis pithecellobii]MTD53286.1 MBL fold metallo-hydrolase [Amycolatopsis pithecellobii]